MNNFKSVSILSFNMLLQLKKFLEENNLTDSICVAVGRDQTPDLQYLSLEGISRTHAQVIRKALIANDNTEKYGRIQQYRYGFFNQDGCCFFVFGNAENYTEQKLQEFLDTLIKFHYNEELV